MMQQRTTLEEKCSEQTESCSQMHRQQLEESGEETKDSTELVTTDVSEKRETEDGCGKRWSLVMLAAASLILMVQFIATYNFGILFKPMLVEFDASATTISWIFNSHMFIFNLSIIFCAPILKLSHNRKILFFFAFLTFLGLFLSVFASSSRQLFITFSILNASGCGITGTFVFLHIAACFKKLQTTALGILSASITLGRILGPYIVNTLLDAYMQHGSLLLISGAYLNISALILLLYPMSKSYQCSQSQKSEQSVFEKNLNIKLQTCKKLLPRLDYTLLCKPICLLVILADSIIFMVSMNIAMLLPFHLDAIKQSQLTVIILTVMSATDLVTRILAPLLIDCHIISNRKMFILSPVFTSAGLLGIMYSKRSSELIASSVIFSCGTGISFCLIIPLQIQYFTLKLLPSSLGWAAIGKAIVSATTGTLTGYIKDHSQNYYWSFFLMLCATVFLLLAWCLEPKLFRIHQKPFNLKRTLKI